MKKIQYQKKNNKIGLANQLYKVQKTISLSQVSYSDPPREFRKKNVYRHTDGHFLLLQFQGWIDPKHDQNKIQRNPVEKKTDINYHNIIDFAIRGGIKKLHKK